MTSMNFKEIFENFLDHQKDLKVISVASCDFSAKPNSAAKLLVDVVVPNHVYYLDYNHTQTYHNIQVNPQISISFMDDAAFTGYRLTGTAKCLTSGTAYEEARKSWEKRLIAYEADRIVRRVMGHYSTKESENTLPKDFVIIQFTALEAAVIKPDRVLRAKH